MSTAALPVAFTPPVHRVRPGTRPALLVAEFRGTGDIAILIPFLRAAVTRYEVTLLAVPNAGGLLQRFVPELFAPAHPQSAWIEGKPCRYKPCFDRCRYAEPFCLTGIDTETVWPTLEGWLANVGRATVT